MKHLTHNKIYSLVIIAEIAFFLLLWVFQPSPFLPSMGATFSAFIRLVTEQELLAELFVSMSTCFTAMLLSFIISLLLAYLGQVKFGTHQVKIFQPIVFFITKLRFFTLVGLSFIFTLYTPDGHWLKIAMLTFGMTVFYITSVHDIVSRVESYEYIHARTLGKSEFGVLWEVIVLGKFHMVYQALIQNFAILWGMLTLVEGVVRYEGGIGSLLLNENKSLHLDSVFAIQFLVLVTGLILDYALIFIGNLIMPYTNLSSHK